MDTSSSYPQDAFEPLSQLEAGSFWFRSRNRLIEWALARYMPRASSFLEVGCGNGVVLQELHARRPDLRFAGTDLYPEGLRTARSRMPHMPLIRANAYQLPFAGQYDAVGIFDVLEHVDDDRRVLGELFRVMRPGGGLIITVPQHRRLWSALDDFVFHRRRYSRRELIEKVTGAGFRITRVSSFVSLLVPAMYLSRFSRRAADPRNQLSLPRPVDRAFEGVMNIERAAIRMGVSWPVGGSLLLIASRP
jgi:SAM-dependent methyltransferase